MTNTNLGNIKQEERKKFDPKYILQAAREILYGEKRKLTPGEYMVEVSKYNEYANYINIGKCI